MRYIINKFLYDNINAISVRVLSGAYAAAEAGEWQGEHLRPTFSRLYYILSGNPYCLVDGQRVDLMPGHCYLLPSGLSFSYNCETPMEQLFFHLRLQDGNGIDMLLGCEKIMGYEVGHEKMQELFNLIQQETPLHMFALQQEIRASILTVLTENGVSLHPTHFSRCVQSAIDYIRSHLSMKLTVEEVAANSQYSESTLVKKFKQEVGISIGGYIDETVLAEAEQLLVSTDLSILEISDRLGFCDQFYFSRCFKLKYCESPRGFRKKHLF